MTTGLPVQDGLKRCLEANEELAARWHRAMKREEGAMDLHQRNVSEGMRIGWAQAIALILGIDYGVVVAALREGKL